MKRLLIMAAAVIACLTHSTKDASAVGTLYVLQESGPVDLRVNVVIFAEGYLASQEATFIQDANNMLDDLLSTSPWNQYPTYVNGYAIFVASLEQGADHPSDPETPQVNTYFNSSFETYGIDRLLTIPPNDLDPVYANGAGKVYNLLAEHMPSYDVVLVLVNDPVYGGSGGGIAVSSMHPSAPEIVIHEMGHSFADLGDEYDDAYPGYPDIEEPNTTQQTVRALIKWNPWILPSTPVPTPETSPYYSLVGLFEGAHYHSTGWYRPKFLCKMRSLGVAFCPICSESHVLSAYELVSPIDSIVPAPGAIETTINAAETLRVVIKSKPIAPLKVRWYDNGTLLPISDPDAILAGADLGPGAHAIKCVVTDTTSLVRMDPTGLLKDSVIWTINVTTACGCDCHADPACDGIRSDVLDVVNTINVAFRGIAPAPDPNAACPYESTDVDCTSATDVLDVVHVVNVAFRGVSAATEFCNPCP